jgi:hypothetical protein
MKNLRLFPIFAAMITLIFGGCTDSEPVSIEAIEGIYVGTITDKGALNKNDYLKTENEAFAEVTKIGSEKIQVHIYDDTMDVTTILDYYEHMDSINVCLTGDDFQNMYGHILGQDHMSGGMMGDQQDNETQWTHHLNDEHQVGDEHFGGFNMQNHSFGYQFMILEDGITHDLIFQGKK